VQSQLPPHAQDIYREAFNHALAAHADDPRQEEAARRIAWAAVKRVYVKVGSSWVARTRPLLNLSTIEKGEIMSTVGLESLEHTVQLTHAWINELDELLGWRNKARSYRLLRTVLQTLRDWLPVNEAADFAAQLPTLLRGVFYEQWRPGTTPVKHRSKADFLARIDHAFVGEPVLSATAAASIAFQFLSTKIAAGEISDIRHALPADVRAMWELSSEAA